MYWLSLREGVPKKAAVLFDFVQITSPLPKFGQLVQLFLKAKNVDLSDIQNENYPKLLLNKGRMFALWVMYTTQKQF